MKSVTTAMNLLRLAVIQTARRLDIRTATKDHPRALHSRYVRSIPNGLGLHGS